MGVLLACYLGLSEHQAWAQPRTTSYPAGPAPSATQMPPREAQASQSPVPIAEPSLQPPPPSDQPADPMADKRGGNALTAGPDPRVRLPSGSRDHAAIFGTGDEDELALVEQERAVQEQRLRLQTLQRVFDQPPASRSAPSGMIPLDSRSADLPLPSMPRLAPTQAGTRGDGTANARRQVDDMQRKVDGMLRNADALRQPSR